MTTDCFMNCRPEGDDATQERFYVAAFPELTIYAHTVDRWIKEHYPEDWQMTTDLRKKGVEWGCFHSRACPDGELGSNDVHILRPISYEAFVEAREQEWPYVDDLTTLAPVAAVGHIDDDGRFVWAWSSLDEVLGERNQG